MSILSRSPIALPLLAALALSACDGPNQGPSFHKRS